MQEEETDPPEEEILETGLMPSSPQPTSAGMDATGERELMDQKVAAAEARVDAKFQQLLGEIRVVQTATAGLKSTIVVTGIAVFLGLLAALIGVLSYGAATFYNGTVIRDMVSHTVAK